MLAPALDFKHTVTERFLRYVVIDTQSDPDSPTCPSTEKQKNLGRLLVTELQAMGIADAHLDPHGYVYATIPANTDKTVPVICFCSHMDTSPDCTGKNVKPQVDIWTFTAGNAIIVLSEGRLLNLGNATGHPSRIMDGSFANQVLAQMHLFDEKFADLAEADKPGRIRVEVLPKKLDEEVAAAMVAGFGGVLTKLTAEQAAYIGVDVDGPFKPDSYKY